MSSTAGHLLLNQQRKLLFGTAACLRYIFACFFPFLFIMLFEATVDNYNFSMVVYSEIELEMIVSCCRCLSSRQNRSPATYLFAVTVSLLFTLFLLLLNQFLAQRHCWFICAFFFICNIMDMMQCVLLLKFMISKKNIHQPKMRTLLVFI